MKRLTCFVLACLFLLLPISCAQSEEKIALIKGLYIKEGSELGPFFYFDTDNLIWSSAAAVTVSYGIEGEYEVAENQIIATTSDGSSKIIFEMNSSTSISAKMVDINVGEIPVWVEEGDVFIYEPTED